MILGLFPAPSLAAVAQGQASATILEPVRVTGGGDQAPLKVEARVLTLVRLSLQPSAPSENRPKLLVEFQ